MGSKKRRINQKRKRAFVRNQHCSVPEEKDESKQQEEQEARPKKRGRPSKQNIDVNLQVPNVDQGQQGPGEVENEFEGQEDFFFFMSTFLLDVFPSFGSSSG